MDRKQIPGKSTKVAKFNRLLSVKLPMVYPSLMHGRVVQLAETIIWKRYWVRCEIETAYA